MRYFKLEEFDSPDELGSGCNMSQEILNMLDATRKIYGKPMRITSGFRTKTHNKKVGGVESSSHLKGLAADIACSESKNRFDMIKALLQVGFKRLGVAGTFIHVDIDKNKSQNVIWTY